jgi:hypothetical protein
VISSDFATQAFDLLNHTGFVTCFLTHDDGRTEDSHGDERQQWNTHLRGSITSSGGAQFFLDLGKGVIQ